MKSYSGHGGNIYRFSEEAGLPEGRVIDFSASINPLGISEKVKAVIRRELRNLHNYPDPDTRELRKRIGEYHGIDPEMILCGNGSTELIYMIVRALRPRTVLIPQPTFSEYERALRMPYTSSRITNYKLRKKDDFRINPDEFVSLLLASPVARSYEMAFLCNPNNPTGQLLKREELLRIADVARRCRTYLVVDEAFIDFCPEESVITYVRDNPYLIVLRSMTKFHALTGLRVGYGVFPPHLIERLKGVKEPWTVNTLAQKTALTAIGDNAYRDATHSLIKREKEFLEKGFKRLHIEFIPSHANFYLLRIDDAVSIQRIFRRKGILVRNCSDFRGLDSTYIRVAVKKRAENLLLIKILREYLNKGGDTIGI